MFPLADPAAWDGTEDGTPSVALLDGEFHLWYSGYGDAFGISGLGFSVSDDTCLFDRAVAPVFQFPGRPQTPEILVQMQNGLPSFRIWYTMWPGPRDDSNRPAYITHATFDAGVGQTDELAPVLEADQPWEGTQLFAPSVIRRDDTFYMW